MQCMDAGVSNNILDIKIKKITFMNVEKEKWSNNQKTCVPSLSKTTRTGSDTPTQSFSRPHYNYDYDYIIWLNHDIMIVIMTN